LAPNAHPCAQRQPKVDAKQRDQAGEREESTGREACPGDGIRDRADAEADRQTDQGEETEEAGRNQRADEEPLQDARRRRRELLFVRAKVEGEKSRQERKATRIDNGKAAGDERDRDRNRVDRTLLARCSTY
jgi:hypothetical protein